MKSILYISICVITILSITSCRSSYSSNCGLANNTNIEKTQQNRQVTDLAVKTAIPCETAS